MKFPVNEGVKTDDDDDGDDRRIIYCQLAEETHLSVGTVHIIVHERHLHITQSVWNYCHILHIVLNLF